MRSLRFGTSKSVFQVDPGTSSRAECHHRRAGEYEEETVVSSAPLALAPSSSAASIAERKGHGNEFVGSLSLLCRPGRSWESEKKPTPESPCSPLPRGDGAETMLIDRLHFAVIVLAVPSLGAMALKHTGYPPAKHQ